MISNRVEHNDPDGTLGFIESIYFSDNVLKSTYFPKTRMMYISFSRGGTYSYSNIDGELYSRFEEVDSQGEFFHKNIAKFPNKYKARKEFTLYPEELNEIKNNRQKLIDDDGRKI